MYKKDVFPKDRMLFSLNTYKDESKNSKDKVVTNKSVSKSSRNKTKKSKKSAGGGYFSNFLDGFTNWMQLFFEFEDNYKSVSP